MKFEYDVYLAGPFFNPAQVGLLEEIELLFEAQGVKYFSPRIHADQLDPFAPPAQRMKTFQDDVAGIVKSRTILAVLDYLQPATQSLCLVKKNGFRNEVLKDGLNFADNGTVWELGVAWAMRHIFEQMERQIVGFKMREDGSLNLMLANSCEGILFGLKRLQRSLVDHQFRALSGGQFFDSRFFEHWNQNSRPIV